MTSELNYELLKFDELDYNGEFYIQILINGELYTGWIEKQ